jgi:UDP-3-O-[3-hydroxymyristoyl] glucosamine N-acyltransferase
MKLTTLLCKIKELGVYMYTCSCDFIGDYCVTYALNQDYLDKIIASKKEVIVLVSKNKTYLGSPEIELIPVDDPERMFILVHNFLNMHLKPDDNKIMNTARVHPRAHIGSDGMKYIKADDGYGLINMKHMGNVKLDECVEVGPFSSIARATLDSTIIRDHVRIGQGVFIGHNCKVGKRTIIVDGAVVGGSAEVGSDCWLGLNCTVRNGIKVCDNVLIAMGAVITKNIDKPGIYVGAPARRTGDWDGSW